MTATDPRPELLSLTRAELAQLLSRSGLLASHAPRLFGHLHRKGEPLDTFPRLSPRQRAQLAAHSRPTVCPVTERHPSADATEKLVFALSDARRIEGVIIPEPPRTTGFHGGGTRPPSPASESPASTPRGSATPWVADRGAPLAVPPARPLSQLGPTPHEPPRTTFCVSSQVGCAMACVFCATATLGLERALTSGEIVAQIYAARELCEEAGRPLRNVVFMGMGEPLHHYETTRRALEILTDPAGFCLGAPRITVSTVGLAPRIEQLGRDFGGRIQLAVSLNAGTEALRRALMPITLRHDLASLRAAVAAYPMPRNRFVLIEYVLLAGLTDTPAELSALAAFVRDLPVMVNLIPWNPFEGAPADLRPPAPEEVDRAFAALRALQVPVKVRLPRGRQATAACGQLARLSPAA